MEIIKRKILLENSIDRSSKDQKKWGVLTASTFYINILITQNIDDMGMFTDVDFIESLNTKPYFTTVNTPQNLWNVLRYPYKKINNYYNFVDAVITAYTESRIEDVRSYDIKNPYRIDFNINTETYTNYEGVLIDGVDRIKSMGEPKEYVFDTPNDNNLATNNQINGFVFNDYSTFRTVLIDGEPTSVNTTTIRYIGEGFNETNTSLSALIKEEYLFGIISPPEVKNDIFIDRGITTVMDMHLRLSEIKNLKGLENYGNGFYKLNKQ
jgi:hypothetical protein